jgi:hypothetical protein
MPPLRARILVLRAVSFRLLATLTMSPSPTKAIAVGPSRNSLSSLTPASSAARFVSVFLTTENRAPCLRISPRTSSISFIVKPR